MSQWLCSAVKFGTVVVIGVALSYVSCVYWKYLLVGVVMIFGLALLHYINIHWSRMQLHVTWFCKTWGVSGVAGVIVGAVMGVFLAKDPQTAAMMKGLG